MAAQTEGRRRRSWKHPEVGDEWGKWAEWVAQGQKAGQTGRYGGLRDEKSRRRERLTGGLPRISGRTNFGPRGRIEKGFHILIQGMRFKAKI
jgi:hypothetical protein